MMHVKHVILCVLGMGFLQSAMADTSRPATEDTPITAVISQSEPTRIKVAGDRIAQVIHKSGTFNMQENPAAGEIFITPAPGAEKLPINLFVITEQGHTYTVVLTPKDIPATNVILNPGNTESAAAAFEQQAPWQQKVAQVMKALWQGQLLPGYQRTVTETPLKLWPGVELTQIEVYHGHGFQGEVYRLVNLDQEPLTLSETRFYRPGVAAVAFNTMTLPAKGMAKVYVVSRKIPPNPPFSKGGIRTEGFGGIFEERGS